MRKMNRHARAEKVVRRMFERERTLFELTSDLEHARAMWRAEENLALLGGCPVPRYWV